MKNVLVVVGIYAVLVAILSFVHYQVFWLPIYFTLPVFLIFGYLSNNSVRSVVLRNREKEKHAAELDLTQYELKEEIERHAKGFLPKVNRWRDLLHFTDVYKRTHHRRELRRLINTGVVSHQRKDARQLLMWLFYNDRSMQLKAGGIYGITTRSDLQRGSL